MTFIPQNKLEESLMKATDDPAHRPQFYKDLLEADIFVVQNGPPPQTSGRHSLETGTQVRIQNIEWKGKPHIPVFSSLLRLQLALREPSSYLSMNAREFMNLTKGANLILNPGSDYGRDFPTEEVAQLLDGTFGAPVKQWVTDKPQQVQIGQPARYPRDLVDALSRSFRSITEVEKAYVAHFFNPATDERPHTLVAIQINGDWNKVMETVGIVMREVPSPDPPTDCFQITGKGGIEDYFLRQCKPFYMREGDGP